MGPDEQDTPVAVTLTLDPEAASVPKARRFVRQALQAAGRDNWADAAELPTSEVVTNAVLHAHTPITIQILIGTSSVQIEVRDENPTMPNDPGYDREASTGRGLALLQALTEQFGVTPVGDGKVVWFRLGQPSSATEPVELAQPSLQRTPETRAVAGVVDVRLLALPTTLWLAARQHHDALLRELALARAAAGAAADLAAADRARNAVFHTLAAAVDQARDASRLELPANHPAPMPDVPAALDLTLPLTAADAAPFRAFRDAVDAAQRLAEAGELLARPGLPEVVAVRRWVCEQVLSQLAGQPPRPWPGADAPEFDAIRTSVPAPWELREIHDAPDGRIAVDDTNHILAVSQPLADLVGWTPDDLVGRRVIALVPPRYREAHTAGYTRYLTTGQAHALNVDLVLPVLTRDGREIDCTFYITVKTMCAQQMFIAHITPVSPAAVEERR